MNENYRALTRAYRPQTFEDIVSQGHVSSTLRNAIKNNRLSHAYMFCGPRGVGKTTMARVLARAVNRVAEDVDGEALGNTLNIVEMDAASNRKIEDIRSLKEVIRVPPQNGRYKIFIIDEVHMLTKEAFNALLKTLEEPPEHAIFIFATTEPHKVLPTILSRVQRFDFRRISVEEIVTRLRDIAQKEQIRIDEESLHVIAKRADGALRDALGLMDQAIAFCGTEIEHSELLRALNIVGVDELFSFMEVVREQDAARGLGMIRELISSGTDIQEFLVTLTEHLRNLYVACQSDRLYLVEATDETKKRYQAQATGFDEEDLMRMLHLVSEAQQSLKDTRQPRVQFEILLLKLIHMNRVRDLGTLLNEVRELKKKAEDQSAPLTKGNGVSNQQQDPPKELEEKSGEEPQNPDPSAVRAEPVRETPSETSHDKESNRSSTPGSRSPEKTPTQDSGVPAEEEPVGKESSSGDTEDDPFGSPSLQTLSNGEKAPPPFGAGPNSEDATPEEHYTDRPVRRVESLEELRGRWPDLLSHLEETAPRTLYFQLQRVELTGLQGRELTIHADNEFAQRLLEENQTFLERSMKRVIGVSFRISCKIQRNPEKKETTSPFERFKQLQKKDPHLKTLVDLFGAELDY